MTKPLIMFAFVYLLANLTFNFSTFEENNWKLSLDKDDIAIYTRSVVSSNFNEFLAEAKMIGSIDLFRSVLLDIEKYPDWMPDCKAVEIIEQVSQDDVTYHMRLKVPFPFARHALVEAEICHWGVCVCVCYQAALFPAQAGTPTFLAWAWG